MRHPVVPDDRLRPILDLYRQIHDLHQEAYGRLVQERQTMQKTGVDDTPYLTDLIYLLKKSRDTVHDMRKELDAFIRVTERVTSLLWTQIGTGESLAGAIASGTPMPGVALNLPSKSTQPEMYEAMMNTLGVPAEFWKETEVVKPHYPGLAEYATKILAEGGNLPGPLAALKETPTFNVTSRKHRDVDVDAMCKQYPMNKDE